MRTEPRAKVPQVRRSKPRAPKVTIEDSTYEDVRQSFFIRLHGEQARLGLLAVALAVAKADRVSAFVDLEIFAHRLRGAAAVFDFPELREDSKSLELAAAAAAIQQAPASEPLVQNAIRILASRLICLNGDSAPPADT